jgi:hypothetical protein
MRAELLESLVKVLMPAIIVIAVFTFLSIAAWSDARKKEREAFYRSEVRKKLIEKWGGTNTEQLMEILRDDPEHSRVRQLFDLARDDQPYDPRRRRDRFILAGLVTAAAGGGMWIVFSVMPFGSRVSHIGILPLIVGVALLIYAFFVCRVKDTTRSE